MTFLPSVIKAQYRDGYRIRLTFSDGSEKTIDFSDWLQGPIFEPLKNPGYFQSFFIDGGTIAWPNGADVAPETLYAARGLDEAAAGHEPSWIIQAKKYIQGFAIFASARARGFPGNIA